MNKNSFSWGKIHFTNSSFELNLCEDVSLKIERNLNEINVFTNEFDTKTECRYITGEGQSVFIEPGMPDLPIILKPVQNISILPLKKLEVFVEVPFTIRLLFGSGKKRKLLKEIVTHKMSKSFFGDSETGDFAYFVKSKLHCKIEDYEHKDKNIYCPLSIVNNSSQNLEFEKMILRVPHLSIYGNSKVLTANPVTITFRGQDQISQISYQKGPPNIEDDIQLIARPREADDKNILKKSFYLIKNLYTE